MTRLRQPASDATCTGAQGGFTLVELMVAGLIASVLLTGLVQASSAARSGFTLQEAIAEVQESERFARDTVTGILRRSGFVPKPWLGSTPVAGPGVGSADGVLPAGDRVVLRTWSDRNCFEALNPELDPQGRAAFFLKEVALELHPSGNLVLTCRYGRDERLLVTQIAGQGLLPGVEAFQALYAEDLDGDYQAERWVRAGQWSDPGAVVGVRLALLIASRTPTAVASTVTLNVLDHVVSPRPDGRLRRVVTVTHAFRGRIQ